MRLLIGGHAQGKLEYAKELLPDADLLEESLGNQAPEQFQNHALIIHGLELMTKDLIKQDLEINDLVADFLERLMKIVDASSECIIIADEIGCGVIPLQKEDRLWRELHGRVLVELAKQAEIVERIICKIPQRIK